MTEGKPEEKQRTNPTYYNTRHSQEKKLQKSDLSPLPPLTIPDKIGPYKIQSLLEKGGMSLLYVGLHPDTGLPIIVKVLSQNFIENKDIVSRFLAEADIIAMADHPNIVKLLGSGTWEKGLYIAMEYIHGASLRYYLQRSPIPLKRALEIILEIAYALCHLHTHHVIHRDLKPENILITHEGKVKVIDFGIAQLLHTGSLSGELKNKFIGTPIYMSPEQLENPESVSYPSDIYSLGILTCELVLGRLPQGQIHLALLPKGLQKILYKALLHDPKDRYSDVVDFIGDISNYLHSNQLEKERRPQDFMAEEIDLIKSRAREWLEPLIPEWISPIELKIAYEPYLNFPIVLWDFFKTENTRGFYIIESCSTQGATLLTLSWIKGLLKDRQDLLQDPEKLAEFINHALIDSQADDPFLFAYININFETNTGLYLSAGGLELLKISDRDPTVFSVGHLAFGIEKNLMYQKTSFHLLKNDTLLLYPLPKHSKELLLGKTLEEKELILKLSDPKKFQERTPYLFEMKYFHGK